MRHNLPWQIKRLVVVQLVQVVSGPPNFEIRIIQHHLWVTGHIFHLEQFKIFHLVCQKTFNEHKFWSNGLKVTVHNLLILILRIQNSFSSSLQ